MEHTHLIKNMNARRKFLPVVLAVIALAGIGYLVWQNYKQSTAAAGPLAASGTIEARQVNIAAELGGRIVQVGPEQGEAVKAGDVLIKLDDSALQAQAAQAKAAVQTAQANYDLLAAGPTAEQVRQAQAAVIVAESSLSRTVSSARPADVAAAQAALQAATEAYNKLKRGAQAEDIETVAANLHSAEAAVQQAQFAYDNAFRRDPAAIGASREGLALQQATNALEAVKAAYDKVTKGADAAQIAVAYQQVVAARAALDRAQNPSREFDVNQVQAQVEQARAQMDALKAGARPEQLAVAKAQIASAEAALKTLEVQMNKLTVKSPADGIVLARSIENGEIASPGATLFEVGRLDALEITVYLPEEKFGMVTPGQQVNVHVDAYPNRTFTATVLRVADQAEFTPRNVQTAEGRKDTVFAVRLSIANNDLALKPGMPADVTFPHK